MPSQAQYSFAGGVWSPYLEERVDLAKYATACRTLDNMIVTKYGAARRRPGTQFVAYAKFPDKRCRLLRFQFSVTTTFVIEMGDGYMRFFSNGTQVTSGGAPYEIVSPYVESELRDVHFAQVNDEMRLVHPDHPPLLLRRLADDNWTLTEIPYAQPALRDENLDEAKTVAASAISGTGITLTASGFTFDPGIVGGYYRIGHDRQVNNASIFIYSANNNTGTAPVRVRGSWEIFTTGTWEAQVNLQRRVNGGDWTNYRSWNSVRDRNISDAGEEQDNGVDYRIFISGWVSGSASGDKPRAVLEVSNTRANGLVKITSVAAGGATATADVIGDLYSTAATSFWAEGAWSPVRGYPRSITLHESRMYYGGNAAQAQTVWASDVDGYDTFTEETFEDADSFRLTLGGTEFNGIQWLATTPKNLLIGTTGGEWSLSSGDEANILTGTSARAVRESELGSEHIQPVIANSTVLFVQKGARDISEMVYSFEQDGFINANLTELAEHITKGGVKEVVYQKHRDQVVWAITGDGRLVGLTYVRKQEVVGWHNHNTQGEFESVTVIGEELEEEEVWFSVKRTVNGGTFRFIERFYPDMIRLQEETQGAPYELFYVDSGLRLTATGLTTVSIPHLSQEIVSVLEDGAATPDRTATLGVVTLENTPDVVMVGLPFVSIVEPMSLEVSLSDGTSQGREKRLHKLITSVFQTSTFKIGNGVAVDTVYVRDTNDPMSIAPNLVSRQIEKAVPSRWAKTSFVRVIQDKPLPLTVLALIRNFRIEGNG